MKIMSIKIEDSLVQRLEQLASDRRESKSAIVREALHAYLGSQQGGATGSFHEAAAEYAGCVDGPGDLSYNPEHMEGFGR